MNTAMMVLIVPGIAAAAVAVGFLVLVLADALDR